MGRALRGDRPSPAVGLGARRPVLRLRPRHLEDGLRHRRGRGADRCLRKIIKTSFPNDDALKPLYLAIKNAGLRWRRAIEWTAAMGRASLDRRDDPRGDAAEEFVRGTVKDRVPRGN